MIIKTENDKGFHPQFVDNETTITSTSRRFWWGEFDKGNSTEQANLQKVLRTINL
jgi:hypothetical protein